MKIGIVNPFSHVMCAETELAKRMVMALARLGHQGEEIAEKNIRKISKEFYDFLLVMHPRVPKMTDHSTYGCLWSPPEWYWAVDSEIYKNIKSYDGYFIGSEDVGYWVNAIDSSSIKPRPLGRLLPSACDEPFRELSFASARLFYVGSNWDGRRHETLFDCLNHEKDLIAVYGNKEAWSYLNNIYKGVIECDGKAVAKSISEAGIGLCFNHPYHNNSELPSMRVFETILASAVVISDYNAFVLNNFGNSVLYVDTNKSDKLLANDIIEKVHWVRKNPNDASCMAREAHSRAHRYTLENQLKKVILSHEIIKYNKAQEARHGKRKDNQLHTELECAKKRIKEIERSWTWRLSKPLREASIIKKRIFKKDKDN